MPRARSLRTVVLDNEAISALRDASHPKHRLALALVEVVNDRRRSDGGRPDVLVPVAVRVEADWDRTRPGAAALNRLVGARDHPLTTTRADAAARIRADLGVSVVDATIAQAAGEATGPVTIVTSDVSDMTRVAGSLGAGVRVARL